MKHILRLSLHRVLWHIGHALALLLAVLVVFERLVPGAVLGHGPLFVHVPLLLLCIAFQPAAEKPHRWWLLFDLWLLGVLCIGRVLMQLATAEPLAWLTAAFSSALVVVFLILFSSAREER
jgi:hypothetical protein